MNDFTKDELECLHNAISLQLRDIPMSETNAIRRRELSGKLKSLIDNYCNHKDVDTGKHTTTRPSKKCEECGVLYCEQCPSAHDFYECLVCDHCGLIKNIEF